MNGSLTNMIVSNMDVVFLFSALAFLGLALTVFIQARAVLRTNLRFFDSLWLLGWFGLFGGINELIKLFAFLRGDSLVFSLAGSATLFASFIFLFIFGYRLVVLAGIKTLRFWFPVLIGVLFIGLPASLGITYTPYWDISTRYFLGFMGAMLSATGLLVYYRKEETRLVGYGVGRFFILGALFFALFAFFGGLLVPHSSFLLSSVLNSNFLLHHFGVPVEFFRSLCAIGIAWCLGNLVNVFNLEESARDFQTERRFAASELKLQKLAAQHKIQTEEIYKLLAAVEYAKEIIFMTDAKGRFTYVNPEFTKTYGYKSADVVSQLTPRILKGAVNPPEYYASFWKMLSEKKSLRTNFINKDIKGDEVKVEEFANPILDETGQVIGYLAIQHRLMD